MDRAGKRLGWVGLGRIGRPMAARLVENGFEVCGWDISPNAREAGRQSGIFPAAGLAEFSKCADRFLMCLSGPDAIEAVVFGEDGIAAAAKDGAIVVDHSTTDPRVTREFATRAAEYGIGWVDMPVSGGVTKAETGDLIAWAGGADSAIEAVRPVVSAYVSKLSVMGEAGNGQLAKTCNQLIVAGTVALWSEMLRYADSAGLDTSLLLETLKGGATDSPVGDRFAIELLEDRVPEESERNLAKDMNAVLNQAAACGFDPALSRAVVDELKANLRRRR